MNEVEAKCYLTKKGGANNSDHTCTPRFSLAVTYELVIHYFLADNP